MHHKFKLEETKRNFLKQFDFQKLTILMSFGLFPLANSSSNLPSISPCIPITTKAMVVIAKG
jgi:hypothetical protein